MDESAYRQIVGEVVDLPCAFAKALLSRCVACNHVRRLQVAEREVLVCDSEESCTRCETLHHALRHAFAFAVGNLHDDAPLPHAREMKVQCGGLCGLHQVVHGQAGVEDVDALLTEALVRYGEIDDFPYSDIVHEAALCYKGRHG